MREAKSKNIKAVNGLYMLVSQAIYASNLFLGIDEAVEGKINKVYKELMNKKLNIVFIGMPSCGKSTIASIISEKLNKQLKDTDKNIENIIGMPISSFLNKDNEQQFRAIETSVVEEVSKLNNVVVSTGGGVIKNEYNITCLKRNGIIIFIDRPLDLLQATSTRPLSSNKNDLEKLYSERYDLYLKYSDYVVKNDSDIENVINKILEVYNENIGN
jgi:shikimate dehydrogenase